MSVPNITITHSTINSGVAVRVLANKCVVDWKSNNNKDPYANGTAVSKVQTQTFENPKYLLTGVHFTGAANTLTYAHLLTLAKIKYSGSNAPTLTVTYGKLAENTLVGSNGTDTSIKVIVEAFNFPLDVTDSKGAYLPVGQITLVETA